MGKPLPELNGRADSRRAAGRWKWLLAVAVLAALLAGARFFNAQEGLRAALDWTASQGAWAPVIFIALYVLAAVLLVPGSLLTLGAGAVFGLARGTLLVSVASTLAATAAFLLGRHLAREAVSRRIAGNERFTALDRAVAAEGWKIVLLTRLSPVFPYTLLNYAFGLTPVKLGHYVLASWLGMLPGTVLYVYLGTLAGEAAAGPRARTAGEWALYAVGLAATAAVTVFVTRLARKALARRATPPAIPPGNTRIVG
jgi:uncharacterized membrane protein YdjX (TVP38/TMEM64 family)